MEIVVLGQSECCVQARRPMAYVRRTTDLRAIKEVALLNCMAGLS